MRGGEEEEEAVQDSTGAQTQGLAQTKQAHSQQNSISTLAHSNRIESG